ncbi:MAG: hypothetical protein ACOVOR_00200 [Rhabdochlamydiaceae bacterium]
MLNINLLSNCYAAKERCIEGLFSVACSAMNGAEACAKRINSAASYLFTETVHSSQISSLDNRHIDQPALELRDLNLRTFSLEKESKRLKFLNFPRPIPLPNPEIPNEYSPNNQHDLGLIAYDTDQNKPLNPPSLEENRSHWFNPLSLFFRSFKEEQEIRTSAVESYKDYQKTVEIGQQADIHNLDQQIESFSRHMIKLLSVHYLYENKLWGVKDENDSPSVYYEIVNAPDIKQALLQKMKEKKCNKAHLFLVEYILYDLVECINNNLVSQIKTNVLAFVNSLSLKKESMSQDRLNLFLQFLNDLDRNIEAIVDGEAPGGSIQNRLENLFMAPPAQGTYNVAKKYGDILKLIPSLLDGNISLQINLAEQIAQSLLAKSSIDFYPDDDNIKTNVSNTLIYVINKVIQAVILVVGFVPWVLFFWGPQKIINLQIKKRTESYVYELIDKFSHAYSDNFVQDAELFDYVIEKTTCDFLVDSCEILNKMKTDNAPEFTHSESRNVLLREVSNKVNHLAPYLRTSSDQEYKQLAKKKLTLDASQISNHDVAATYLYNSLNEMLSNLFSDRALKNRLSSLIYITNKKFQRNREATNLKEIKEHRKNLTKHFESLVKTKFSQIPSSSVFGNSRINEAIKAHLLNIQTILSNKVTWKHGIAVYIIAKPLLEKKKCYLHIQ